MKRATPQTVRQLNRQLVLKLIIDKGPLSRAELSRATLLTKGTVSQVVSELLDANAVIEVGAGSGEHVPGRKPILLRYNKQAGVLVGIDMGGTNVQCGVADLEGALMAVRSWPSEPNNNGFKRDRNAVLERTMAEIDITLAGLGLNREAVRGLAVASPGAVDPVTGEVSGLSPNLPDWHNFNLKEAFRSCFVGAAVTIENDVNAALIGEARYGAGRGKENLALLVISTGIGGAVMVGGQLYRGTRGASGEVGFLMFGEDTLEGDWTGRGCFETLASGRALAVQAQKELGHQDWDAEALFSAAGAGDPEAQALVRRFADRIALAVVNIAAVLDPEMIILGGGVSLSAEMFLGRVREMVRKHAPVEPDVVPAGLGAEAGMHGTIALAREAIWK